MTNTLRLMFRDMVRTTDEQLALLERYVIAITQRGVDLSELADLVQGAVNDAFIIHDHNTKHNGGKTDKS